VRFPATAFAGAVIAFGEANVRTDALLALAMVLPCACSSAEGSWQTAGQPPAGTAGGSSDAAMEAAPGVDAATSTDSPATMDASGTTAAEGGSPRLDAAGVEGGALTGFVHPGILVNKGQLDFLKQQIAAGAAPWMTAFTKTASSRFGAKTYTPAPVAVVECGPYSNPNIGCSAETNDAVAAYTQALLWTLTGDPGYAQTAVKIMNAWSAVLKQHTNSNAPLQSAWAGSVFPRAAEIIRYTYDGWAAADVSAFGAMLRSAYLPEIVNGAPGDNGNWELAMAEGTMAIGVFLDDRATFDEGVALWRRRVPAYIYLTTDGATPVPPPGTTKTGAQLTAYWYNQTTLVDGLMQETCRDFGHVTGGLAAMVDGAETARIQGVDLYGEQAKRISAAMEFHAHYINGAAVPSWLCGGALTALQANNTWEIAYNNYANRAGMSLPETAALVARIRPVGVSLFMAWESLTHAEVGSAGLVPLP
jgi:hypothetical protein